MMSQVVAAVERCPKPDATFSGFLAQFAADTKFQRKRVILPLVYRYGSYWISNPEIELWDANKIQALKEPLMLPESKRKERGIVQEIPIRTEGYVEVYHHKAEADTYQSLFKFRKVEGCWYLEEIHDTSL